VIVEPDHYELASILASLHIDEVGADSWSRILGDLHPKQRAFVDDPSPRKIALKGRRAGGSHGIAAWLLENWQEWGGHLSLFIAQSQDHAKRIIWPTLVKFDAKYGLGVEFNNGAHTATLPNGYQIKLSGAADKPAIERLRGFSQGLRRVVIDECGSFQGHDAQFKYLINDVLVKQFMDTVHLGGGQLALVGSPGLDPIGYFFECSTGRDHQGKPKPQWPCHRWTPLDNPHIDAPTALLEDLESGSHILDDSTPQEIVTELLRLRDVPANDNEDWTRLLAKLSAAFRREVLALWVRDNESRVYAYTDKNLLPPSYGLAPTRVWRKIIGVDVGWSDGNGFCVAAKCLESNDIILLEAYRVGELGTKEIAQEILRLKAFWDAGEIYVDTGGVGDQRLDDLGNYGVWAQRVAKGARKKPRIEYFRSLLENSSLKIRREHCVDLLTEWVTLSWSPDRQTHRQGVPDDVTDAALHAVFPLSQLHVPPPLRPRPGSDEWRAEQERRELDASIRQGRRIKQRQQKTGTRRVA
jgi:hypothetical protein